MTYKYLRLIRATTGSYMTVLAPFEATHMDEQVAYQLHGFVYANFPGFEISDFWSEDQKTMHELSYV